MDVTTFLPKSTSQLSPESDSIQCIIITTDERSCGERCAVVAGGVGGVMSLIIVSQSLLIVILLLRQKKVRQAKIRWKWFSCIQHYDQFSNTQCVKGKLS